MNGNASIARDLLLAARRGDQEAAERFDSLWREPLLRFCLGYLQNPQDAEDASQEVLSTALRDSTEPDDVRPWLLRLARNRCLNVRRGLQRRRDAANLPSGSRLALQTRGFLTRLVEREALEDIERSFAALNDAEQEALRLRYGDGLSRAEIASITDASVSVVKSRLFEGLRKLRDHLGA